MNFLAFADELTKIAVDDSDKPGVLAPSLMIGTGATLGGAGVIGAVPEWRKKVHQGLMRVGRAAETPESVEANQAAINKMVERHKLKGVLKGDINYQQRADAPTGKVWRNITRPASGFGRAHEISNATITSRGGLPMTLHEVGHLVADKNAWSPIRNIPLWNEAKATGHALRELAHQRGASGVWQGIKRLAPAYGTYALDAARRHSGKLLVGGTALAAYGAHRLQPTVLPNAIESIKNRWSGNE